MRRTETPKPIWIKFCMVVDIPDVVTYRNFGNHRLRGFWVAGVKFPPLPLTFIDALTLCERVICKLLFRSTIFLYKLIVYIVLDYDYYILYFATRKWPLALCCLINE